MIRLGDALVLAHTKLRTHRVRTGITIGVAGILFGLIFGAVFVAQGVFESVERFNEEGLADRSIVMVTNYDSPYFNAYDHLEDDTFVADVKRAHEEKVALKTAAARKYSIPYEPKSEDPSPIEVDPNSGKERISESALGSELIEELTRERTKDLSAPLDIQAFLEPYRSATILPDNRQVQPSDGMILPMEDGKERILSDRRDQVRFQIGGHEDTPTIQVLNGSIVAPFIMEDASQIPDGEIPGIVSFSYAEKLLGLEKLAKNSTNEEKLARLQEVRDRIGEVSASFCYRNAASQDLLAQATAQHQVVEREKSTPGFTEPTLMYALPAEDSCGAVTVAKDSRTPTQRQADANLEAYQKEIGAHPGEPEQYKVTLRAIGLSGDAFGTNMAGGAGELVMSLLGSWLGYGATWSVPADMLAALPERTRPEALFGSEEPGNMGMTHSFFGTDSYMVEFGDKSEARAALGRGYSESSSLSVVPFGSGALIIDQAKGWFTTGFLWALGIVGGVALIILAGLIGRMVSDGRRESAVFRAIGARRIDIGSIYGLYALLLSLRVALFAIILGLTVALAAQAWLSPDATTGARLAYAAADTDKEFHFIGFGSWYIPAMLGVIVATGLIASVIPILLGARRNPISDMRDDT